MNLNLSIGDLFDTLKVEELHEAHAEEIIDVVYIDSRLNYSGNGKLFLCLSGNNFNGHDFIDDVYAHGIRSFVVSDESAYRNLVDQNCNVALVKDSVLALQSLAKFNRSRFDYPVIAITGSNGKTTVKEWLYECLKNKFRIVRSPKSYNSQIGVALSILEMDGSHELAIIEAGISQPGEMNKLREIISPSHGVFTGLGKAHLENFKNSQQLLEEKLSLFTGVEKMIYLGNDEALLGSGIDMTRIIPEKNWSANEINRHIVLESVRSFFPDIEKPASSFLEEMSPPALRLEVREGLNDCLIVVDTYNSDLVGLEIAIKKLKAEGGKRKKVVFLSDFDIHGDMKSELYEQAINYLNDSELSVYTVGEDWKEYAPAFKNLRKDEIAESIREMDHATILLKSSRVFKFETLLKEIEKQSHETKLIVDSFVLKENFHVFKKGVSKDTKIILMLKAFAYGVGLVRMAKLFNSLGVSNFGVAYPDEGKELRRHGVTGDILVMNAQKSGFHSIIENNLIPAIYSFSQLDSFIRTCIDQGIKNYPIHVKIDTGMRRLGFMEEDLDELIETINVQPEVSVIGAYTHLAQSNVKNDPFTFRQIGLFEKACTKLETKLHLKLFKHCCNSDGIMNYPSAHFDAVRLGIGLYGLDESGVSSLPLKFVSTISQIKRIKQGESIGYGRSFVASKNMKIATVAVGYADGIPRKLSNSEYHFKVRNEKVKTAGNVCMDMLMLDVTNVDCREGDEVVLFETASDVIQMAKISKTIPYEILTGISERVERIYVDSSS